MRELCYSALDVACVISGMELGERATSEMINTIWESEHHFIYPHYREDLRKFYLDVHHWINYLYDKQTIDMEYPIIQSDLILLGHELREDDIISDFYNIDLFFKNMRIQLAVCINKEYKRLKLRTLLRTYGYKKRSKKIMKYIKKCLVFYHIETFTRGGILCNVEDIGIDEMITFRLL